MEKRNRDICEVFKGDKSNVHLRTLTAFPDSECFELRVLVRLKHCKPPFAVLARDVILADMLVALRNSCSDFVDVYLSISAPEVTEDA